LTEVLFASFISHGGQLHVFAISTSVLDVPVKVTPSQFSTGL